MICSSVNRLFFMTPPLGSESEDNWVRFRVSPHADVEVVIMVDERRGAEIRYSNLPLRSSARDATPARPQVDTDV
jgi:hypothetical protein